MRTILLQGVQSIAGTFLASYLLKQEGTRLVLLFAEDQLMTRQEVEARLKLTLEKIATCSGQVSSADLGPRLRWATYKEVEAHADIWGHSPPIGEAWCVTEGLTTAELKSLPTFIEQARQLCVSAFNLVVLINETTKRSYVRMRAGLEQDLVKQIVDACSRLDIPFRIFETSLLLDESAINQDWEKVDSFGLAAISDLRSEIEGRLPSYFDYQSLRIRLPKDAEADFIRPQDAVASMLQISAEQQAINATVGLIGHKPTAIAEICDYIQQVSGTTLLFAAEDFVLNDVDELFRQLLSEASTGLSDHLCRQSQSLSDSGCRTVILKSASSGEIEAAVSRCWQALAKKQAKFAKSCNVMPEGFVFKSLNIAGSTLRYATNNGIGPVVLILNALGQGLQYWYPLSGLLSRHYRVIVWETRGLDPQSASCLFDDQVRDVEAVIKQEACRAVQMICWCTAPKTAIRYARLHPEHVTSLVLLNSTFKGKGLLNELDTDYERNLESLTRVLVANKGMVTSIMRSLQTVSEETDIDQREADDPYALADRAISLPNLALRTCLVAPFQSEASTLRYADQLIDFWRQDAFPALRELTLPILFLASSNDAVASPDMSRRGADEAQCAMYQELAKAGHHAFYERPRAVAERIHDFFLQHAFEAHEAHPALMPEPATAAR